MRIPLLEASDVSEGERRLAALKKPCQTPTGQSVKHADAIKDVEGTKRQSCTESDACDWCL